jgi:hypothetical protein
MRKTSIAALFSSVLASVLGLGLPSGASALEYWDHVRIQRGNYCLEANPNSPPGTAGGGIQTMFCNERPQQNWVLMRSGNASYYRIYNKYSRTCLDRPWVGESSPVYMWPCHDGVQQRWKIIRTSAANRDLEAGFFVDIIDDDGFDSVQGNHALSPSGWGDDFNPNGGQVIMELGWESSMTRAMVALWELHITSREVIP